MPNLLKMKEKCEHKNLKNKSENKPAEVFMGVDNHNSSKVAQKDQVLYGRKLEMKN